MRVIRYVDVYPTAEPDYLSFVPERYLPAKPCIDGTRRYRIVIDLPDPEVDAQLPATVEPVAVPEGGAS